MKNLFVVFIWFLKRHGLLYCLCDQAKEEESTCLWKGDESSPSPPVLRWGGWCISGQGVSALGELTFWSGLLARGVRKGVMDLAILPWIGSEGIVSKRIDSLFHCGWISRKENIFPSTGTAQYLYCTLKKLEKRRIQSRKPTDLLISNVLNLRLRCICRITMPLDLFFCLFEFREYYCSLEKNMEFSCQNESLKLVD